MRVNISQKSLGAALTVLLFAGGACPSSTVTYQSTQAPQSELTAEQRASIRNIMAPFKNDAPPVTAQTHADLALKTPDEIRAIRPLVIPVLMLDAALFPFPDVQFVMTAPDKCSLPHYHGPVGLTLNLTTVSEPADPCGFGGYVIDREVDAEALVKWFADFKPSGAAASAPQPQGGTIKLRGGIFGE